MSFPSVASRSFPGPKRGKQAGALATLATAAIVAGCGGAGSQAARLVAGPLFSVEVPLGWQVERRLRLLAVSQGAARLEVRRFPLRRPYAPALFATVSPEIDRVAHSLGAQLGAQVTGRTVTAGGRQSRQYDLVHGDVFEQLTFVLRARTEYQLYCRRGKSESNERCARLVSSFRFR